MTTAGCEPAIPTCVWPQTHALDCAAPGIDVSYIYWDFFPLPQHATQLFGNSFRKVLWCGVVLRVVAVEESSNKNKWYN
jgi:hypothetical protein